MATYRSSLLFVTCIVLCFLEKTQSYFYIPSLPARSYIDLGDINIGAVLSISVYDKNKPCGDSVTSTRNIHYTEAIAYAVHRINEDPNILNGTRLGLVVLDDCFKETTTIAQALRFVPIYGRNESTCPIYDHGEEEYEEADKGYASSFDVLGVIGARRSSSSIAASLLLGPTRVPLLSFTSTSDELSNKEIHPYFMRVVPPDKYQAEAIIDFIRVHGWTYISAIYEEGSYGELGYKNIKTLADQKGICIAIAVKLQLKSNDDGYRKVIRQLLEYPNAKVVVSFGGASSVSGVFKAVKNLNAGGKFIWIGSDAWAAGISSLDPSLTTANGIFAMSFFSTEIPGFYDYYSTVTMNSSLNPWFHDLWQGHFGCSINAGTCDHNLRLSDKTGFQMASNAGYAYDAVYTFAHALNRMGMDFCPGVTGTERAECIKEHRHEFLGYLRNTSFEGVTGYIKFDSNGNLLGRYVVLQANISSSSNKVEEIPVGVYDLGTGTTTFQRNISWDHIDYSPDFPWPESVCSKPCLPGEFLIQKELPCCWECRKCRMNEIITHEGTQCQICQEFYWPSQASNLTECLPISPDYPLWTSPMTILICFFACFSLVASISILAFYVTKREVRIIKASSRELSYLQLCAIASGYVTVLIFLDKPTPALCQIGYFLFCLSFNALYAPMFVKAMRVHRIFQSGKTNRRPRFTSPKSQILFASILIVIQVVICAIVFIVSPPDAVLSQPVSTEKYVELNCQMTTGGLASFLGYNLFLVFMCSVLAFKTRSLPDNFNESRFVSMCVSTTLVIWLAFMPSYFTAVYKWIQKLLLTLALILNHGTALIFLFAPKVYAVTVPNADDPSQAGGTLRSNIRTLTSNNNRPNLGTVSNNNPGPSINSNINNNNNNNNNNEHDPGRPVNLIMGRSNTIAPSASENC